MKDTLTILLQLQELEDPSKHKAAPETVAALKKRLPSPVVAHYDRCRARKRKPVAVVSSTAVCGSCHMRLSRGLLAALQRGDEIQVCENCGTYLLWEAAPLNPSELQRS